jgi:glycosyl hydrolase family 39 (putative alpha-L-iduronidase)
MKNLLSMRETLSSGSRLAALGAVLLVLCALPVLLLNGADNVPSSSLIPRRSSQIKDGFGINSNLPRAPYVPPNRWWWTRMFDAGVNFIRIGQYENSSDYTGWDWVERKRGQYSVVPELDDYVDSLVENGVHIEMQLLYGNPLYTSPAGRLPQSINPASGSAHNPDRSIYALFWPPKTPEQIEAFANYARWMVNHFRGRVEYYEIWNEPNINYWNPTPNPEDYGRLFKAAAAAIHETDPKAKVVFGGLAGADRMFAKRALDVCGCAANIDVVAYHIYPDFGHNLNPEAVDDEAHANQSPKRFREMVRNYPGMRKDLVFWNDEYNNAIPSWTDSDESVQAKYVPRGLVSDRAAGVRTFVWLIVGATDGNELDDFGMLHGFLMRDTDFTPRRVFGALQNTNTVFSDTELDPSIAIRASDLDASELSPVTYGFRSKDNRAVIAYWLPVLSKPALSDGADQAHVQHCTLQISNSGIQHPVLIDIGSGSVTPISWKAGSAGTLEQLPLKDSVLVVADQSYLAWPELPEAPSDLNANTSNGVAQLTWNVHGGHAESVLIERRTGSQGKWQAVSKVDAGTKSYTDRGTSAGHHVAYRVRAANASGNSAYSNVAALPD